MSPRLLGHITWLCWFYWRYCTATCPLSISDTWEVFCASGRCRTFTPEQSCCRRQWDAGGVRTSLCLSFVPPTLNIFLIIHPTTLETAGLQGKLPNESTIRLLCRRDISDNKLLLSGGWPHLSGFCELQIQLPCLMLFYITDSVKPWHLTVSYSLSF